MSQTVFHTIDAIKQANAAHGGYWFSPGAMRFFHSRILGGVIGGCYFITSERFDWNTPRLYTVRMALPDGSIEDASEFQQFRTANAARRYAYALAGNHA